MGEKKDNNVDRLFVLAWNWEMLLLLRLIMYVTIAVIIQMSSVDS